MHPTASRSRRVRAASAPRRARDSGRGFEVKLSPKERADLEEHQRNAEIIRRKDRPAETKAEFKDRQLDVALEYLRSQIKTAARLPAKKAG